MDDPEIIYPYEIEEGELPPPPADSGTSSDSEPEVEAEDEDGDEATVDTITRASYSIPPFSGLMLEDKEEKERLKKKLRASQQEKEQIEQAFCQVIEWIRKQFGVEIPPCMGDDDATTP
nr:hypothetical protein [Tanacetum cinerariifolium]